MSVVAEWSISGPLGYVWTPAEIAQIARAAQAFQDALPTAGGRLLHLTRLDGLGVIDGAAKITWPQPGDQDQLFGPAPCSERSAPPAGEQP